MFENGIIFQM